MEILEDIHHSTKKSENFEQWFTFIDAYTEQLTEQNLNRQTCDDAVSICTLHSSKGLEYENVLILDVNEGMMPYNKSVLAEEIEEERRMFYVGMTRAKQSLILCFTNERYNKKVYASRFLDELDKTYVKQELICNEKQN
jgi:DNA helicase-2/ATP-dependent DNA helicase PcrA